MKKTIKFYGYGWVNGAMHKLFPNAIIDDPKFPNLFNNDVNQVCDVAFVAVPTPLKEDKTLDISILESVVARANEDLIIIRSATNPGDCDMFSAKYKKNIVSIPEYLGETPSHPLMEEKERKFLIIGGTEENRRKAIELFTTVYNANITIRQVTNYEAEVIKLSENRAIAFKVMQCQELYDACEAAGLDYYKIRDAVYGDDPRFNLWWTFIYPKNRGFNSSKCLVKDVPAWATWAESIGAKADVTKKLIEKSNQYEKTCNNKTN